LNIENWATPLLHLQLHGPGVAGNALISGKTNGRTKSLTERLIFLKEAPVYVLRYITSTP